MIYITKRKMYQIHEYYQILLTILHLLDKKEEVKHENKNPTPFVLSQWQELVTLRATGYELRATGYGRGVLAKIFGLAIKEAALATAIYNEARCQAYLLLTPLPDSDPLPFRFPPAVVFTANKRYLNFIVSGSPFRSVLLSIVRATAVEFITFMWDDIVPRTLLGTIAFISFLWVEVNGQTSNKRRGYYCHC